MAVSPKSIQERIADAFGFQLNLLLIHSAGLPEDVEKRLRGYEAAWDAVSNPGPEGSIHAWASQLSDEEAMAIARWIWETATRLNKEYWNDD